MIRRWESRALHGAWQYVVVAAGWPSYSAILVPPCWEKLGGFLQMIPFFCSSANIEFSQGERLD
jgi:hypothetical protein